MNLYSIPPLITSIFSIFLGLFVFLKNKNSSLNKSFNFLCFSTFIWQFSWFLLFNTKNDKTALLLIYIGYSGIIFIPITYFHFILNFLNISKIKRKYLTIYYLTGLFFLFILYFTKLFINGYYNYHWGFYPKANTLHLLYLIFLTYIAFHTIYLLVVYTSKKEKSLIKLNQQKYMLFAAIAYLPASIDFITNYGYQLYPTGFIFVNLSLAIFSYAIVKHQLMDIRIAITRAGIFSIIYTIILGIPFLIGIKYLGYGFWMVPVLMTFILATIGPYIYNYIKTQAEDLLLKEDKRAHQILMQAAKGMTMIRDIQKLVDLIVLRLMRTMKVANALIYVLDKDANSYVLKSKRSKDIPPEFKQIREDDEIVRYMTISKKPILLEEWEIQKSNLSTPEINTAQIREKLKLIGAKLVIPCFILDTLIGFLVLGEKKSKRIYTNNDIEILTVLASQAALALENAMFYEETSKDLAKHFHEKRILALNRI